MNIDNIMIVEPERVDYFYPFSIIHCIWELRCGCFRLFEKIKNLFPSSKIYFSGRQSHKASFLAREMINNDFEIIANWLIIDPTYLITEKQWNEFVSNYQNPWKEKEIPALITSNNNNIIAAYVPAETIKTDNNIRTLLPTIKLNDTLFNNFQKFDIGNIRQIKFLWDAIKYNGEAINDDSQYFENIYNSSNNTTPEDVHLINKNNILIGENCKIMPQTVFDASGGKIIIGNNVQIMSHSTIIGPCFIGDNSTIKIGSRIYKDSSFGNWCKVGGEIENTIIHSFSNKQHDGYLGNSYICEWVNLGAGTNNSNLKNTYSNIKIRLESEEIDTGSMFLGLLCGDHTKSAIATRFNTGTVAGICSILFYENFHPNFIPSFSWGGRKDSQKYKFSKAIEIAKIVMKRRNKKLTPEEIQLMKDEYEKTIG